MTGIAMDTDDKYPHLDDSDIRRRGEFVLIAMGAHIFLTLMAGAAVVESGGGRQALLVILCGIPTSSPWAFYWRRMERELIRRARTKKQAEFIKEMGVDL